MSDEQVLTDQTIDGLKLRLTCDACPEQYDVYYGDNQVAYFRLRWGIFRVDVPDCGGKTIYTALPNGDGQFEAGERQRYLTEAVAAVTSHLAREAIKQWCARDTEQNQI